MKLKSRIFITLMVLLFFCLFAGPLPASDIRIDSSSGGVGETIRFNVLIGPVQNEIDAFGFDIIFDSQILSYSGFSPGPIANDLTFFDANPIGTNTLRVGGISLNPIKPNSAKTLLTIDLKCISCNTSSSLIRISRQVDDFENWSYTPGRFTCTGGTQTAQTSLSATQGQTAATESPTAEKAKTVKELSYTGSSEDQKDSGYNMPYMQQAIPSQTYTDQTSSGGAGGGGAGGGSTQEAFDTSALSKVYGQIPAIYNTAPENFTAGIPTDATIRLQFNQSMDHFTVENAFIITPHVDGRFEWENSLTELEFIPYRPLLPGVLYHVQIYEQAKDIYGRTIDGDNDGKMGGEFCLTFQTEEIIENTQEEDIQISPKAKRCFIMSTF